MSATSHVFFHQTTVLKKLKAFQLWGRYLLNCEMGDFVTSVNLSLVYIVSEPGK